MNVQVRIKLLFNRCCLPFTAENCVTDCSENRLLLQEQLGNELFAYQETDTKIHTFVHTGTKLRQANFIFFHTIRGIEDTGGQAKKKKILLFFSLSPHTRWNISEQPQSQVTRKGKMRCSSLWWDWRLIRFFDVLKNHLSTLRIDFSLLFLTCQFTEN